MIDLNDFLILTGSSDQPESSWVQYQSEWQCLQCWQNSTHKAGNLYSSSSSVPLHRADLPALCSPQSPPLRHTIGSNWTILWWHLNLNCERAPHRVERCHPLVEVCSLRGSCSPQGLPFSLRCCVFWLTLGVQKVVSDRVKDLKIIKCAQILSWSRTALQDFWRNTWQVVVA